MVHSEKDVPDPSITPPPTQESEHAQRERLPTTGFTAICPANASASGQSAQPEPVASLKSNRAPSPCQVLSDDAAERVTTHPLLATPGFLT